MALADYKLCDVCGNKAFYDANIDDTRYTATWDDREKTPPIGIAVLCPGCNQTHEAVIRPRPVPQPPQEPTPEAVERAANRRSPVINASVPDEVAGRIARELGSDGPPFYVPLEVQRGPKCYSPDRGALPLRQRAGTAASSYGRCDLGSARKRPCLRASFLLARLA